MASNTSLALQTIIEEALQILYRPLERPLVLTMGSNPLSLPADNSCTLAAGDDTNTAVGDVWEYGQELMLVTAKTSDTTPVFTLIRGYIGSIPAGLVPTGFTLNLNPQWPRRVVARNAIRSFRGAIGA